MRALVLAFATLAIIAACGSDHPRAAEDGTAKPAAAGGTTVFNIRDGGSTVPPGCGTKDDGTACECLDAPLFIDPPTIYFVLDASGSMGTDDKWTQVRLTVASVMRSLGPRANFGATAFPAGASECGPGIEVLPLTPGDPPSSTQDGPAVQKLITATGIIPGGGTPTSATLSLVDQHLKGVSGRAFVILATDGAPNCNDRASCGVDQCQPNIEHFQGSGLDCQPGGTLNCCAEPTGAPGNCNDGPATIAAISAMKARNVPVYVIGLPGTEFPAYSQLLNQMAIAGGTAQTNSTSQYFAVKNGSSEVLGALKKIAAQITGTCVFDFKTPPADPKLVNVYIDDAVLPQEPVNGWTIDGKAVTLVGAACEKVKNGDVLSVRIIAGCPTIYPK